MRASCLVVMTGLILGAPSPSILLAQDAPAVVNAKPMPVQASIKAVTVYPGRASVTRSATLNLEPGAYALEFGDLPPTVQPATLQARSTGNTKVIGVDFAQETTAEASSPAIAAQDAKLDAIRKQLREIADQRELLKSQEEFVNGVSVRATTDATKAGGTEQLSIEALRKQLEFVTQERERIMAARRDLDEKQASLERQQKAEQAQRDKLAGAGNVSRVATVTIVATERGQCEVDLAYLVANATWQPAYNVRADIAGSAAVIEYDAVVNQRTGEDWNDVKLTLSTAQPTVAANPPAIQPWFVDIQRPVPASPAEEGRVSRRAAGFEAAAKAEMPPAPMADDQERDKAEFRRMVEDAAVSGGGPSVTFELPRAVTVKTDSQKQQRTRIAAIDTLPQFVHVAVPMLTPAVYLRGDLKNQSSYQLLAGPAAIFIGNDYVGPTNMPSVAPNGSFDIHFGIDPAVKATRQMVSKKTENTGLLAGGRRTSYGYRIDVDNGTGKPVNLELWDRIPVSRNGDIQVELVDLSDKLAADAKYTQEQQPQGLLKWSLAIPAGAAGKSAAAVTWGVRINRAKDVEMTALPE